MPLRGRRVRAWVVGEGVPSGPGAALSSISGVSGLGPIFDTGLLAVLQRLARWYVHPLSAFLGQMTPPRMGRAMAGRSTRDQPPPAAGADPEQVPRERYRTVRRLSLGEDPSDAYLAAIAEALARGRGALVVVPEVGEGSGLVERLLQAFPNDAAAVHSSQSPAARSRALWSVAGGARRVVVGGRAAVLTPALPLGVVIVHDESHWTLKAEMAPYYDARDVAEARAAACGADLVLAAAAPSLGVWHRAATEQGWEVQEAAEHAWPTVEPSQAHMPRRLVAAVQAAAKESGQVLVYVPRTEQTASGPGPAEVSAYLQRNVSGSEVTVITEGGLAALEGRAFHTVAAIGVDSMIHRPSGRSAEEAFRTLWDLAGRVAPGTAHGRLLLETRSPDHHVVDAVVRGDYGAFARRELAVRQESEAPPFVTLVRIRNPGGPIGDNTLRRLADLPAEALGPVPSGGGRPGAEILLKVREVETLLDPLRGIVASAAEPLLVEMSPRDW